MATAWLDPDDLALVPDPGYPTYSMAPQMVGAGSYPMPLLERNDFLPDFSAIPEAVLKRARLMWLNYPNNPTGAIAPDSFLRGAVAFCRKQGILLCFDAPYCENTYDGYVAPSILQYEGAMDVALEFNSLSKSHNLAGWRVAMAVGNSEALQALATVKSNVDSGSPLPVQEMAAAALTGDQSWLVARNAVYQERRDIVLEALEAMGLRAIKPTGAIYVWIVVPAGWQSMPYTEKLLTETGVSLAAGSVYGEHGEGYLRLSLVQDAARIREAMRRWQEWSARQQK
jgi:LL-diaminopimelate aminotransferase